MSSGGGRIAPHPASLLQESVGGNCQILHFARHGLGNPPTFFAPAEENFYIPQQEEPLPKILFHLLSLVIHHALPSPLQDYVTYWMHRMYHLPSLYRDGHRDHSNDSANWAKLTFQLKRLNLPKLNARKCIRMSTHDRRHFHKLHHTYKQPTAFSVTAIHPVEFVHILP